MTQRNISSLNRNLAAVMTPARYAPLTAQPAATTTKKWERHPNRLLAPRLSLKPRAPLTSKLNASPSPRTRARATRRFLHPSVSTEKKSKKVVQVKSLNEMVELSLLFESSTEEEVEVDVEEEKKNKAKEKAKFSQCKSTTKGSVQE